MRTRESHAVCLSVLIILLTVAPAFAFEQDPLNGYQDFANVYEMNSPWNTGSAWAHYTSGTAATWDDTSSPGFLIETSPAADNYDSWSRTGLGASTTWSFELRARVNSQGTYAGGSDAPAGLFLRARNSSGDQIELVMQTNAIKMRNSGSTWVTIDTDSNTSYSTIRIARDGAKVRIYRNGSTALLGGQEFDVGSGTASDSIRFGDNAGGTQGSANFDIDYLAFDAGGAYIPEPATLMLLASGLAVCLLAKRR